MATVVSFWSFLKGVEASAHRQTLLSGRRLHVQLASTTDARDLIPDGGLDVVQHVTASGAQGLSGAERPTFSQKPL